MTQRREEFLNCFGEPSINSHSNYLKDRGKGWGLVCQLGFGKSLPSSLDETAILGIRYGSRFYAVPYYSE